MPATLTHTCIASPAVVLGVRGEARVRELRDQREHALSLSLTHTHTLCKRAAAPVQAKGRNDGDAGRRLSMCFLSSRSSFSLS